MRRTTQHNADHAPCATQRAHTTHHTTDTHQHAHQYRNAQKTRTHKHTNTDKQTNEQTQARTQDSTMLPGSNSHPTTRPTQFRLARARKHLHVSAPTFSCSCATTQTHCLPRKCTHKQTRALALAISMRACSRNITK